MNDNRNLPLTHRCAINLGDLAEALSHLQDASPREQEMIAKCLGFQINTSIGLDNPNQPFHPRQAAWNRQLLKERRSSDEAKTPAFTPQPAMPPAPEPQPDFSGEILATELEIKAAPKNSNASETLIHNAAPLLLNQTSTPIPRKTLFSNRTARGIVAATAMQPTPGQDLDIPQLIQASVRRQNLKKLPVLPRFTARNGCQLLLDYHEALMPWWDDMQSLIVQFQKVLGEERCPVYEFENAPSAAFRWTENGDIPWQPAVGKPVIVASDLGVMQPPRSTFRAGKAAWYEFTNLCKQHHVPVIVLSPLHPQRCPHSLDRSLTLIHWHPATTAAIVKRLTTRSGRSCS